MELTVKQILFGDPQRGSPDAIDMKVLRDIAGREGTTQEDTVRRLIGRELTKAEIALVSLSEELTRRGRECSLALVDLIDEGLVIDSGETDEDGYILWIEEERH